MADIESKIILNADTGEAVKNVAELKDRIREYKAALEDTNATADDNRETAHKLAEAQGILRDVMNSSTTSLENAAREADVAGKSYNTLVHEMANLTKVWRATTDEAKREEIGKQINKINTELKRLDATRGNFQRNVGNYPQTMAAGIGAVKQGLVAAVPALNGVNNAMSKIAANPMGAVILGVTVAVKELTEAFKRNEDAMAAVSKQAAPFQASLDMLRRGFDNLVTKITEASEGQESLGEKFIKYNPVIKAFKALLIAVGIAWERIADGARWFGEQFGKVEQQVKQTAIGKVFTNIYNKIADIANKLVKSKIGKLIGLDEFMEKMQESEQTFDGLVSSRRKIADIEREIAKTRREATVKNAEDEKRIAELKAEAARTDKYSGKERKAMLQEAADLELGISQRNIDLRQKELDAIREKNSLTATGAAGLQAEAEAQANLTREQTEYFNKSRRLAGQIAALNNAAADAAESAEEAFIKEVDAIKIEEAVLEDMVEDVVAETAGNWQRIAQARMAATDEAVAHELAMNDALAKNEMERAQTAYDITLEGLRKKKAILDEAIRAETDPTATLDLIAQRENLKNQIIEESAAREREIYEQNKQVITESLTQAASAIDSILSTVADAMKEHIEEQVASGKMSQKEAEKEFKRVKALQISQAVIQMLSGIVSAISTAQQLGPIAGPIMAAINSAAVAASGAANIAQIKKTNFGGGDASAATGSTGRSMSTPATVSAPQIEQSLANVRNITPQSEVDAAQDAQKVVLVMSELEAAQNVRKVQVAEASF